MTIAQQVQAEQALSEQLAEHVGEWVAVRDSKIVATAPTLDKLSAKVADDPTPVIAFEVGDDADVGCFF